MLILPAFDLDGPKQPEVIACPIQAAHDPYFEAAKLPAHYFGARLE